MRFAILSPFSDPPCGSTRFSADLSGALTADGSDSGVIWLVDGSASSVAACKDALNQADVAVIQLVHGIDADGVVGIVGELRVPSIVIVHEIPKKPTAQQRSSLESVASIAARVVVLSETARQRLCLTYAVDRNKIVTIPHGATVPTLARVKRPSRPVILTWGMLRPGKGVERVIDVMPLLEDAAGRPRYLVAGPTDRKTLAADGEAYREARAEQARRCGVADSVKLDPAYYDGAMRRDLIQQSSVVVLPYDSTEQVTSGVLVEAIASGRPVVATAFPHAVELLGSGAGIVVDHDDPTALATALRRVVTEPRLAGSMAAEARRQAPEMAWAVVAKAYLELARRVLAERRPSHDRRLLG